MARAILVRKAGTHLKCRYAGHAVAVFAESLDEAEDRLKRFRYRDGGHVRNTEPFQIHSRPIPAELTALIPAATRRTKC